jgi:energy-coupling factor transporter ATP-binding protein EcfA2
MGCTNSKPKSDDEVFLQEATLKIDAMNEEDAYTESEKIKLLLLGTGESGKSTVMKQMRIIYGDEYSTDELESFKLTIQQNCVTFMETLCKVVRNFSPADAVLSSAEFNMVAADEASTGQYRTFPEWTDEYVAAMVLLWQHPAFQSAFNKRCEYQIIENTYEFMNKVEEVPQLHTTSPPSSHTIVNKVTWFQTPLTHAYTTLLLPQQPG